MSATPVKDKAPTTGVKHKTARQLEDEAILTDMETIKDIKVKEGKSIHFPSAAALAAVGGMAGVVAWLMTDPGPNEQIKGDQRPYVPDQYAEDRHIEYAYEKCIIPGWKDHTTLGWFKKYFRECWDEEIKRITEREGKPVVWEHFHDALAWVAGLENQTLNGIYLPLDQQKITAARVGDHFVDLLFRLGVHQTGNFEIINYGINGERKTTITHKGTGNLLVIKDQPDDGIKIYFSPCVNGKLDPRDIMEGAPTLPLSQNIYDLYKLIQSPWTDLVDHEEIYLTLKEEKTPIERMASYKMFAGKPYKYDLFQVTHYLKAWHELMSSIQSNFSESLEDWIARGERANKQQPTHRTWDEFYAWVDKWATDQLPEAIPNRHRSEIYCGTIQDLAIIDGYILSLFTKHKNIHPDADYELFRREAKFELGKELSSNENPTWGNVCDFLHVWANKWYRLAPHLLPYVVDLEINHPKMAPDLKKIGRETFEDANSRGGFLIDGGGLEYKNRRVYIHEIPGEHPNFIYRLVDEDGRVTGYWSRPVRSFDLVYKLLTNWLAVSPEDQQATATTKPTRPGPMNELIAYIGTIPLTPGFTNLHFNHDTRDYEPNYYKLECTTTGRYALFAKDENGWWYSVFSKDGTIRATYPWRAPADGINNCKVITDLLVIKDPEPAKTINLNKTFTTFGGTDCRVMVNGVCMGTVQAISYEYDTKKDEYNTEMAVIIMDKSLKEISDQLHCAEIELIAANEYGNKLSILKGVMDVRHITSGITVDDLMMEAKIFGTIREEKPIPLTDKSITDLGFNKLAVAKPVIRAISDEFRGYLDVVIREGCSH